MKLPPLLYRNRDSFSCSNLRLQPVRYQARLILANDFGVGLDRDPVVPFQIDPCQTQAVVAIEVGMLTVREPLVRAGHDEAVAAIP